jgi:hypothetical protein
VLYTEQQRINQERIKQVVGVGAND